MPSRVPSPSAEGLRILLRRGAIERRTRQLAAAINRDFRGRHVHLAVVLKGAAIFSSDLIRHLTVDVSIDYLAVWSYGSRAHSSGEVRLTMDLDSSIEGLNVILVEDILESGLTVSYLERLLRQRKPRSLRLAVLLAKSVRRRKPVKAHYIGFRIPDQFVVGYGMDYAERYRNLRDICVLSPPQK